MTGPHPLPPEDSDEHGMQPLDKARENQMGATFQAMAEAMRANAEALHRIDSSQRQMAESLHKNEKVTQVVTSTKALNETSRGLSEIQRGLLETLVRDRRPRGGGSPLAMLLIAGLACMLGVLIWENLTDDGRVSRELFDDSRRRSVDLEGRLAIAEARSTETAGLLGKTELERDQLRLDRERDKAALKVSAEQLERNKAQVGNFIQVKEQADAAGALILANEQLQRVNGDLRQQVDRLRTENKGLWGQIADGTLEGRMGDPEAIIKRARKMKIIPDEAASQPRLTGRTTRELTLIRRKLKRLLESAASDQGYELLKLKGVREDTALLDIEVGRYERHLSVGSIVCKELEIRLDAEKDTVELRFKDGYLANLSKPGEKIALDPAGHSVFLKGIGVKNWIEWVGPAVAIAPDGLVSWK